MKNNIIDNIMEAVGIRRVNINKKRITNHNLQKRSKP